MFAGNSELSQVQVEVRLQTIDDMQLAEICRQPLFFTTLPKTIPVRKINN